MQVASIIVRSGDRILVEAAQHFYDGRIRERNHPPSEKMQAGETILVAALRGLQEELNVTESDITLLPESVTRYTKTIDSYSFPGLTATYEFYVIEALIPSLPRHAFETVNLAPKELDPVHIHHWAWQPTVGKLARYQRA